MTDKRHKNLKPFKKGQSGNPGGRPKLPPELKAIAELTSDEIRRIFAKYGRMTKAELSTAIASPEIPMIDLVVASGFAQAAKGGDFSRLAFVLDRTIGKVKEQAEARELELAMIWADDGRLLAKAEAKQK